MLTKVLENAVTVHTHTHTHTQSISRNNLESIFALKNKFNMLKINRASLYQKI